jgi:hypothetical protein
MKICVKHDMLFLNDYFMAGCLPLAVKKPTISKTQRDKEQDA